MRIRGALHPMVGLAHPLLHFYLAWQNVTLSFLGILLFKRTFFNFLNCFIHRFSTLDSIDDGRI